MLKLSFIKLLSAAHLSGDLWFNEILKYTDNFDDALSLGKANDEIIPFISPIVAIKRNCDLTNSDIWPLAILNLNGNFNQTCMDVLAQHSNIYQSASVTVQMNDPFNARKITEFLKPKDLAISFPDYNQDSRRIKQEGSETWNSINGVQLNELLESIQLEDNKKIRIIMM